MSKRRPDITLAVEEDIRGKLKDGGTSVLALSRAYNCSQGLIRSIRDGVRHNAFLAKQGAAPPTDTVLCTACNTRPKDPDLRKLCRWCYEHAD